MSDATQGLEMPMASIRRIDRVVTRIEHEPYGNRSLARVPLTPGGSKLIPYVVTEVQQLSAFGLKQNIAFGREYNNETTGYPIFEAKQYVDGASDLKALDDDTKVWCSPRFIHGAIATGQIFLGTPAIEVGTAFAAKYDIGLDVASGENGSFWVGTVIDYSSSSNVIVDLQWDIDVANPTASSARANTVRVSASNFTGASTLRNGQTVYVKRHGKANSSLHWAIFDYQCTQTVLNIV
jgi:hypothetical protein